MTVITIFVVLIIGLNCIPLLAKTDFPKTKKVVVRILLTSTILFVTFTFLGFLGYRLKSLYSVPPINLIFIFSTILYFVTFKNTKRKILAVFTLTPFIVLSLLTLTFWRVVNEFKIDQTNGIIITAGGFLACGENITVVQSRFGIFYKEIFNVNNLCLKGIHKIETLKHDENHSVFLIYHDGEYDSENPFKYSVERKNGW